MQMGSIFRIRIQIQCISIHITCQYYLPNQWNNKIGPGIKYFMFSNYLNCYWTVERQFFSADVYCLTLASVPEGESLHHHPPPLPPCTVWPWYCCLPEWESLHHHPCVLFDPTIVCTWGGESPPPRRSGRPAPPGQSHTWGPRRNHAAWTGDLLYIRKSFGVKGIDYLFMKYHENFHQFIPSRSFDYWAKWIQY